MEKDSFSTVVFKTGTPTLFRFAAWRELRLNTHADSIGRGEVHIFKANLTRFPARRSNAAARSRNFLQCTQGLSIQDDSG